MALSAIDAKRHQEACTLLPQPQLSVADRITVIEQFHEGAIATDRLRSAHFTPPGLAHDLQLNVFGHRILDLCAGIGALSFAHVRAVGADAMPDMTCVEIDPWYVDVGKKVVPEARWICGDIMDAGLQAELRQEGFDMVIGNPPHGKRAMADRRSPHYQGNRFEYAVMDVASDVADRGVFLVPEGSAPFFCSGRSDNRYCRDVPEGDPDYVHAQRKLSTYQPFHLETGIELRIGLTIDTAVHRHSWRGILPDVEIVVADFERARVARQTAAES